MQLCATLVVYLTFVIVVAEGRRFPFGHLVNCPQHRGGSSIPAALSDGLLHIELSAFALTLTHGARGGQRSPVLHHQLGWREERFVLTLCICLAETNGNKRPEFKINK